MARRVSRMENEGCSALQGKHSRFGLSGEAKQKTCSACEAEKGLYLL